MSWDPWPRPVATLALSLAAQARASGTPRPVGPGTPSRFRPASRDSPANAGVRQRLRPREPASADSCPSVRSSGLSGSGSPGPLTSLARSAGGLSPLPGRPRRRLGEGLRLASPPGPPGAVGDLDAFPLLLRRQVEEGVRLRLPVPLRRRDVRVPGGRGEPARRRARPGHRLGPRAVLGAPHAQGRVPGVASGAPRGRSRASGASPAGPSRRSACRTPDTSARASGASSRRSRGLPRFPRPRSLSGPAQGFLGHAVWHGASSSVVVLPLVEKTGPRERWCR